MENDRSEGRIDESKTKQAPQGRHASNKAEARVTLNDRCLVAVGGSDEE